MRFGFFDQLQCPEGYSEPRRLADMLAQIELGEALGFDTAWLGELHFSRAFSILSDPLLRPLGYADIKSFEAFRQVVARMDRVRYDDTDREMGVFGEPEYCVERVRALKREYGMDEFICYFNQGGLMDRELVRVRGARWRQ